MNRRRLHSDAIGRLLGGKHPAERSGTDFSAYRADPVGFAENVLRYRPWSKQAEFMAAVAANDRVSLRSGHKTGKSDAVAALSWWWAGTRGPAARVILTAPTARQVHKVLWRAIRSMYRNAAGAIAGVEVFDRPENGAVFEDGREIIAFSTDEAEKFAGLSGDLLFIADEASGLSPSIYEALEGSTAGDAKVVLTGNPTKSAGPFFDSHHDKADLWRTLHISSEDSPNITGEREIKGLATKKWIDARKVDWGEESPLYAVRVKGEWPSQASNAVCSMAAVESATTRWFAEAFAASASPLVLGVDPARFGADESVIFAVRGTVAAKPFVFRGLDTVALSHRVFEVARDLGRNGERVTVYIDETGLGGGVVDQLKRYRELNTKGVNAGASPGNPRYERRRDELWFGIAEWLKTGSIPDDPKLIGELTAVEYSFTPTGKIKVEPKEELRKRLGRSPDRADALALAVGRSGVVAASFGRISFSRQPAGVTTVGTPYSSSDDDDDAWSIPGATVLWQSQ